MTRTEQATNGTLTEIQGLRALSVLLVVAFHLWPWAVRGGFVGVDAFFVISGFLITSHLFKEVSSAGRVHLASFWARRIRRLLPAAFAVLGATLVAVLVWLPDTTWSQVLHEIRASSLYSENWVLAHDAVDYFAEDNLASPVQHYWSLAVEEQFYLVWPLLITVAVLVVGRRGVRAKRLALVAASLVVLALSQAYSAHIAVTDRAYGYFSPFSHAWEFAAGGLVALAAPLLGHRRTVRWAGATAALSWAGWAMLVTAALTFSGTTAFPGVVAWLPVGGVLAVIVAGASPARWAPTRLFSARPVQTLGDLSYSLYLWHWPLIVIVPFAIDRQLGGSDRVLIAAVAVVLAWLTKRYIEDPVRFGSPARMRTPVTFAATAVVSSVLLLVCWVPQRSVERQTREAVVAADTSLGSACFGAAAMLDATCDGGHVLDPDFPPAAAKADIVSTWIDRHIPGGWTEEEGCHDVTAAVSECAFGDPSAAVTIALVGDSHARTLLPPVLSLAEQHGWRLQMYWKPSCRPALPEYESTIAGDRAPECLAWKTQVVDLLAADPDVDLIVTSGATTVLGQEMTGPQLDDTADAFAATWRRWADAGRRVLVVHDVPYYDGPPMPDCVAEAGDQADPCTVPRALAAPLDPTEIAMTRPLPERVSDLDLTPAFCDARTCHAVVGGIITHRDPGHTTTTFTLSLEPPIDDAVLAAMSAH